VPAARAQRVGTACDRGAHTRAAHAPAAARQDGVVLGADTRSTSGSTVADKNCEKIHFIAPNIYCCGAGTAADTMSVTAMISSSLELHRYATGRQSRVTTAMTMLKSHLFRRALLGARGGRGGRACGEGEGARASGRNRGGGRVALVWRAGTGRPRGRGGCGGRSARGASPGRDLGGVQRARRW
jgi:hypothetical protein